MDLYKYLFLGVLFIITMSASCEKAAKTPLAEVEKKIDKVEKLANRPYMTFDKSFYDLGKVKKGEKRNLQYKFTNTVDTPLEIEIVTACECTTLDYSTEPVPPGKEGIIDAIFDSSEKDESEDIDITIILKNTDPVQGYPIVEEVGYHFDLIVE